MGTRVNVLGSGTPTPHPDRFGSAFLVDIDGECVLVDCGPATTWKLAKAGFSPTQVGTVLFTHHHFDHDVDYPCFLLTRWDQGVGSEPELEVLGPSPTVELTDKLIGPEGAFTHDYLARIHWPASQQVHTNRGGRLPRKPPVVRSKDIDAGYVHETPGWTVRSALADHAQPYLDCLAYRLETPAGSVVFTGDTQPCDSVRDLALDADVLLCMCWDTDEAMAEHGETEGVCGPAGAAQMAAQAGVEKLVLIHTGPQLTTPVVRERVLGDIAATYDGEVVVADELMSIELGAPTS